MPFKTGKSGNPSGRPQGSKNNFSIKELEKAIEKIGKNKKKNLYEHFVERAYEKDSVLIALMKKLLPDMKYDATNVDNEWLISQELEFIPKDLTDEQKKGFERFYHNG